MCQESSFKVQTAIALPLESTATFGVRAFPEGCDSIIAAVSQPDSEVYLFAQMRSLDPSFCFQTTIAFPEESEAIKAIYEEYTYAIRIEAVEIK